MEMLGATLLQMHCAVTQKRKKNVIWL